VLQVAVSTELMRRHPGAGEGDLSWMRQGVVGRAACAEVARDAGLDALMVEAAPPARRDQARELADRPSVRAALAEAVIGAAWLDLGAEITATAVVEAFAEPLARAVPGARDPKTALQEEAARRRIEVRYEPAGEQGPPQARTFTSRVRVGGRVLGEGSGASKQASERAAAERALAALAGGSAGGVAADRVEQQPC
jgi:ribonuclease III